MPEPKPSGPIAGRDEPRTRQRGANTAFACTKTRSRLTNVEGAGGRERRRAEPNLATSWADNAFRAVGHDFNCLRTGQDRTPRDRYNFRV